MAEKITPLRRSRRSHLPWKRALPSDSEIGTYGIYSERFFAMLLRYERTRSDRSDSPLTIVTVDLSNPDSSDSFSLSSVIETIKTRIKTVDSIGWRGAGQIAVLFPGTDQPGVAPFVDYLGRDFPGLCSRVSVSSHPSAATSSADIADVLGEPLLVDAPGCSDSVGSDDGLNAIVLPPVPRWKRALDIFGATCGLIVLAPLFLCTALYIKIVSPGPVLFTQDRIGRGGRAFKFFKFRSMHVHADQNFHADHAGSFIKEDSTMQKLDDSDPRIFLGGKILRVSCVDELPQLYNIFRGEMSLVGPRPCIPYEAAEYHRWHRHRFDVLPGLTGLWQVSGKNKLSFAEMVRLDIQYQRTMSLGLDLVIILRTIPTIFMLIGEAGVRRLLSPAWLVFCALLMLSPEGVGAQSALSAEGANRVRIGVFGELEYPSLTGVSDQDSDGWSVGSLTAISIAETMDVGGYFAHQTQTINGTSGTNLAFGFVYSLTPVRQQPGVPFSFQLGLTYGLVMVAPELAVAELQELTGQTYSESDIADVVRTAYTLGFGVSRVIRLGHRVWSTVGADVVYRVDSTAYGIGALPDDDDEVEPFSQRTATALWGPHIGFSASFRGASDFTFLTRILFDNEFAIRIRPELNFVLAEY